MGGQGLDGCWLLSQLDGYSAATIVRRQAAARQQAGAGGQPARRTLVFSLIHYEAVILKLILQMTEKREAVESPAMLLSTDGGAAHRPIGGR